MSYTVTADNLVGHPQGSTVTDDDLGGPERARQLLAGRFIVTTGDPAPVAVPEVTPAPEPIAPEPTVAAETEQEPTNG